MTFELAHSEPYPLSLRIALLLTFAFVFFAVQSARRSRLPLVVLTLPLWWSFAAVYLGLSNVAAAQSFTGDGRYASAAGVAEAHIPLAWGCFAIFAVSVFYAWRVASSNEGPRSALATIFIVTLVFAFGDFWLSRNLLYPYSRHAEWKFFAGLYCAAAATVALVVAVGVAFRARTATRANLSRSLAATLAVGALVLALLAREVVVRLQAYAMGP